MNQEPADFGEFYIASRDRCLRAVYGTVGNLSLAEELVAEGFARAFASWRKVSLYQAPSAWVVRTALNLHISWWRRRRHEVEWETGVEQARASPPEAPLDARVLEALKALPLRQREVIALRIFMDLDTQETARELGISPGTVKAHLSRAMATLRSRLDPRTIKEESR